MILEDRRIDLAKPYEQAQLAVFEPGRYLCFQISGKYFAMAHEEVREMMPMQTPAPWTSVPSVLGVIHSRQRRIPVIDIHAKLKLQRRARRRQGRLVVATGSLSQHAAFPVDTIAGLIEVRPGDIHNGVIQGFGRPKTIISMRNLATADELALCG